MHSASFNTFVFIYTFFGLPWVAIQNRIFLNSHYSAKYYGEFVTHCYLRNKDVALISKKDIFSMQNEEGPKVLTIIELKHSIYFHIRK